MICSNTDLNFMFMFLFSFQNSTNGAIAMNNRGLNKFVKEVLQNLQANKDANNQFPRTDCWLHFGHVFVSGRNVDEGAMKH